MILASESASLNQKQVYGKSRGESLMKRGTEAPGTGEPAIGAGSSDDEFIPDDEENGERQESLPDMLHSGDGSFIDNLRGAWGVGTEGESREASAKPQQPADADKATKKKWNVLIYADGANNLDPRIMERVEQLRKDGFGENVNVLIRQAHEKGDVTDFQVMPDGELRPMVGGEKGVKHNMGEQSTLQEFLKNGIENYPAEHQLVVISGHGGGYKGVAPDENQKMANGKGDLLTLPELEGAMQGAKEANGGKEIDAVIFDACIMSAAEVASQLKGEAGVMIGSQETNGGYDFGKIANLASRSDNGTELGKAAVFEGISSEAKGGRNIMSNEDDIVSAIDIHKMAPLEESMRSLSTQITSLDREKDGDAIAVLKEISRASRREKFQKFENGKVVRKDIMIDGKPLNDLIPEEGRRKLIENMEKVLPGGGFGGINKEEMLGAYFTVMPAEPTSQMDLLDFAGRIGSDDYLSNNYPELVKAAREMTKSFDPGNLVIAQRNGFLSGQNKILNANLQGHLEQLRSLGVTLNDNQQKQLLQQLEQEYPASPDEGRLGGLNICLPTNEKSAYDDALKMQPAAMQRGFELSERTGWDKVIEMLSE